MKVYYLDRVFEINITSFTAGRPAKLNALPENCYPEEPSEVEWEVSDNEHDWEFLENMLEHNSVFYDEIQEQVWNYKEEQEPEEA